jgi:hypothetical protein
MSMMFLRADFGCEAMRSGALAAAYLRSQGRSLDLTLSGRPFTNNGWIRPDS